MKASDLIDRILEEIDLEEKKMSAKARAAQKKFRMSAAGKKSARMFAKKKEKGGYRPDPKRSRASKRGSRSR